MGGNYACSSRLVVVVAVVVVVVVDVAVVLTLSKLFVVGIARVCTQVTQWLLVNVYALVLLISLLCANFFPIHVVGRESSCFCIEGKTSSSSFRFSTVNPRLSRRAYIRCGSSEA